MNALADPTFGLMYKLKGDPQALLRLRVMVRNDIAATAEGNEQPIEGALVGNRSHVYCSLRGGSSD
jgi:hypothetical protein